MKITLYNDQYDFTQKLDQEYIDDYNLDSAEPFDCMIEDITPEHPFAYGWLEMMGQSDYR